MPCSAYEHGARARSNRLHGRSGFSHPHPLLPPPSSRTRTAAGKGGDGDGVFGAEKRGVFTGPNPLHNK